MLWDFWRSDKLTLGRRNPMQCRYSNGDDVVKNGKRYRIAYPAIFPYADGSPRYIVWELSPTGRLKRPMKQISENGLTPVGG
jgi:hypothetical protein